LSVNKKGLSGGKNLYFVFISFLLLLLLLLFFFLVTNVFESQVESQDDDPPLSFPLSVFGQKIVDLAKAIRKKKAFIGRG